MDWVPIVFITFKALALGTAMFFAIKWHYDRGTSSKPTNIPRVALEVACYVLIVAVVYSLVYGLLHYLGLLPDGLDF